MSIVHKILKSPFIAFLFISSFIFVIIIGLRSTGSIESLELAEHDWLISLKPDVSEKSKRIVIITITEQDILKQGRWPLTDATLAKVLSVLSQYKPRAIGLDIFRDIKVPPGHEELNSILTGNPYIIGVMKFGDDGVPAPPALRDTEQVGFNDIIVDPGGIVRRALIFMDDGKTVSYSFALKLALLYLQKEGIVPESDPANPQHLKLGKSVIRSFEGNDGGYIQADARGYQFMLDFEEHPGSFLSFSLTSLLSGEVDAENIKDKIVFVGVEAQSVKDVFFTPRSRSFQSSQQCPGVILHARIASELVRYSLDGQSPISTISDRLEACWILLWCVMGGAMGLRVRSPWRFSLLGLGGLFILSLTVYSAFLFRLWIPLVPPAMAWLISAMVVTAYMSNQEKSQRKILMQLFSKHVSPEIAELIWRQREQIMDAGRPRPQKLVATVFFSDMKGFTSVSEKMDPQSLMDWLNIYMESMTQLIMQYGGVVDDFAGDGIKADFGVPLPRINESEIGKDAMNAVECALEMEKEMARLNLIWKDQDLPSLGIRIGIFTGPVVSGALGSSQRMKYTTIGDSVNIASRLESYDKNLAKESLCRIIIGESTLRYLGNNFVTEPIGQVSLKGKDEKIPIHRVLDQKGKNG